MLRETYCCSGPVCRRRIKCGAGDLPGGSVLELGGEGRGQAVNFGGGFFVAGEGLTGSGGLENGQEGD